VEKKSFETMPCAIARALEHVGEWWNILILRDVMNGLSRFDEFQKSLGIVPNTLTRRLGRLVDSGLLMKRRYSEKPPRDEYVLTERGHDFMPVLAALYAFGEKHYSPKGSDTLIVSKKGKKRLTPIVVDKKTGEPITCASAQFGAGPASSKAKMDFYKERNLPIITSTKGAKAEPHPSF